MLPDSGAAVSSRRPTELQIMIASATPIRPDTLVPCLLQQQPHLLGAYTAPPLVRSDGGIRFTIFEPNRHVQIRRAGKDWTMIEFIAEAHAAVTFRVGLVQVLAQPLHGFPVPQLVLTPTPVGHHVSVPTDCRPRGRGVYTLAVPLTYHRAQVLQAADVASVGSLLQDRDLDELGLYDQNGLPVRDAVPFAGLEWVEIREPQPAEAAAPDDDEVAIIQLPAKLINGPLSSSQAAFLHPGIKSHSRVFPRHQPGAAPDYDVERRLAVKITRSPDPLPFSGTRNAPEARDACAEPAEHSCPAMLPATRPENERRFYTILEPRLDYRRRPSLPTWTLWQHINDAVRQVRHPVWQAFVITAHLPGFPGPQITLSFADAPQAGRAIPVDLRPVGGELHTVELPWQCDASVVWLALQAKGVDLPGNWQEAQREGGLAFFNHLGVEIDAWDLTGDVIQWVSLRAPASGLNGPDWNAIAARVTAILPTQLANTALHGMTAASLHLYECQAAEVDATRAYSLFHGQSHLSIREAEAHWTVGQYLADATKGVSDNARRVQILSLHLPSLPTPQIVVTPLDTPEGSTVVPVDARGIGGGVHAIAIGPAMPAQVILEALASAEPQIAAQLQHLAANDAVFLQDAAGHVWDSCPDDVTSLQWLATRLDHRLPAARTGMWLPAYPPESTTFTTTGAITACQGEYVVTIILAGGGTVVRLAPQRASQVDLAASLTELLLVLAAHGRLPRDPVLSIAAAMPRTAAQPRHVLIGFIVQGLAEEDQETIVLQDQSHDGSLLVAFVLDTNVMPEHMLAPAQVRRGFTIALNGSPQSGSRRALRTGDLIQLQQEPHSARVWTAAFAFQIIPASRLFALRVRLPSMRRFTSSSLTPRDAQAARQYLTQAVQLRMLEQTLYLGEPGRNSHNLTFSGLFDPDTAYVLTPVLSGTVPIVVSVPRHTDIMTVLYPTPDETDTVLQLFVPPDTPLHLLGLLCRRGMELVYPTSVAHGAVIRERAHQVRSAASSIGPADMSLLQTQAKVFKRSRGAHIPTPLGRRRLPAVTSAHSDELAPPLLRKEAIAVLLRVAGAFSFALRIPFLGQKWFSGMIVKVPVTLQQGHNGHLYNEIVDAVAKAGAALTLPGPVFAHAFWAVLNSPLLSWAWLAKDDPCRSDFPTLSRLAEGGYEARDAIPDRCLPALVDTTESTVTASLCLTFVTCNVQTLRDKRPLVLQQLTDRGAHVTGLQETREGLDSQCFGTSFAEFAAAGSQGEGGVTLLFNMQKPYGWAAGRPLMFDKSHFTCIHADSRCIAVQVRAPHLRILCVSAHAPHSGHTADSLQAWWRTFEQAPWLRKHQGRTVLMVDANAQLGSVTSDSVGGHAADDETPNGSFLRSWVDAMEAFLPSTISDAHGRLVPNAREPTWFSPSGQGYRIDYVALPAAWSTCRCCPATWPDFELLNKDHLPATVKVQLQLHGRATPASSAPTFPRDPAQWPPEVHEAINQRGQQCRPPPRRRYRAFVSPYTAALLEAAKACRKCIAVLQGLANKLSQCQAQGRPRLSSEGWSLSDTQCLLHDACLELRQWRSALRKAVAWDKHAFVRSAHERLCSAADPFDSRQFFDALKALRPPGKRVLKPFAALVVDEDAQLSRAEKVSLQQQHFADLEAGLICPAKDLQCSTGPSLEGKFELKHLPKWDVIEAAFRSCKARKAPGADQIPDWVWKMLPQKSVELWLPIFLKAHVRLSEPVQFKHTLLFSLFKGKGSPASVSNYRAIALLSGPGKVLRKQLRSTLLRQLPDDPLQQGGIPHSLLQGAHQVLKMHASIAAAVGASNCALFLDVSSAYYRVLRQAFHDGIEDDRQICSILRQLGVAPESLHSVCAWLSETNLIAGADQHEQRLLREYFAGTFFTMREGGAIVRTHAGTRPGDAIADALFALVQADFLAGLRQRLDVDGLLDDPVVREAFSIPRLLAPVWADDTVLLLASVGAEKLLLKTTAVLQIVHLEFTRRGMAPNYARGKSEAMFSFRGRGAPAMRQKVLIRTYVHLGGVVNDKQSHSYDICQHLAQARRQIKPMRRPVLRDTSIPLSTRKLCLSSLALSCVTVTAPTWGPLTKAEFAAWRSGYVGLLRCLHRDDRWSGRPTLPGEQHVCAASAMPSAGAFLRGQRLLHFRRVCLTQPVLTDLLLAEDRVSNASWFSLLREDVEWLHGLVALPDEARHDFPHGLADWTIHHGATFKTVVKKALRKVDDPRHEASWNAAPLEPSLQAPLAQEHCCPHCPAAFPTKQSLSAHMFARHGKACEARSYLHGTVCPVCLCQFWTTARATRHLQHDSPKCLRALQDHGMVGDSISRKIDASTSGLPSTRLVGPLLPLHVDIPSFASQAAQGDSAILQWRQSCHTPAMLAWLDSMTAAGLD
ncbi:unnamed protein product [Symbiodinium sp. CCMP2456]|nr:unnamed protein product [Symbiodinium sp. CCMP2456]